MTRENKLALVVGFGLILFVGILISDHFAPSPRRTNAELGDPSLVASKPRLRDITELDPRDPAPPMASAPGTNAAGANAAGANATGGAGAADPASDSGFGPGLRVSGGAVPTTPDEARQLVQQQGAPATLDRTVVVREGDTIYNIAVRELGDGASAQRIMDMNGLKDARALRPGVTLRLPGAAASVERVAFSGTSAGTPGGIPGSTPGGHAGAPAAPREYVVREGDTLVEIAKKFLGKGSRVPEIVELNKERVPNPNRIAPGTRLLIPAATPGIRA